MKHVDAEYYACALGDEYGTAAVGATATGESGVFFAATEVYREDLGSWLVCGSYEWWFDLPDRAGELDWVLEMCAFV